MRMRKIISELQEMGADFGERKLPLYASSATYSIAIAMVPVVMLIVSLVQFLPITEGDILNYLREWMPEQVMTVVSDIIAGIYSGGKTAVTVSILLTVWSASAAMRAIMRGIQAVYDDGSTPASQNIVIFYLRAILYMVVFVVILLLSFVIMAQGEAILRLLMRVFPDDDPLHAIAPYLRYGRFVVVTAILLAVFILMFRFIPARKVRLRAQVPGAVFSALSWVVFSLGFSYYIGLSNHLGAYGIIGTSMIAMLWLYYCLLFLLAGAWLNCWLEKKRREKEGEVS